MSKKIIIITSVVLSLILAVLIGYYFLTQNNSGTGSDIVSGFKNFFPFGGNDYVSPNATSTGNNNNNDNNGEQTQPAQNDFVKKLRKLSSEPVSGAGTADFKAGTVVHYIEKATGHIFEVELFSPKQGRISNTTIPVVYDAIWGNKNNSLVTRYLREDNQIVDTYSMTLKGTSSTTENTLTGIPFPANISDVSVYDTNVFYLEQDQTFATGFTSKFDGSSKKQIWVSPVKEFNSQFVNDKTVALTTKPSPNIPGFLYLVDTGTGGIKNILRNVSGLSTLTSPDSAYVLYLTQDNSVTLSMFKQSDRVVKRVDFLTFPEKCVWSQKDKDIVYCAVPKEYVSGNSLTDWYKGLVSYSDDIFKYSTKEGYSSPVIDLSKESSEKIDVVKPILSENGQYLVFINKKDNSLWSLDLSK